MGIWAGIKYAINSTLGTDKFKPLNELIIGEKSLCASDTIYDIIIPPGSNNTFSKGELISEITFLTGGSVKLKAIVARGQIDVIINTSKTYTLNASNSEQIIPISDKDSVQIKATGDTIIIVRELLLCAQVEDTSLISRT